MVTIYGAGIQIQTHALTFSSSTPCSEVFWGLTTNQYDCVSSLGLLKYQTESHHKLPGVYDAQCFTIFPCMSYWYGATVLLISSLKFLETSFHITMHISYCNLLRSSFRLPKSAVKYHSTANKIFSITNATTL